MGRSYCDCVKCGYTMSDDSDVIISCHKCNGKFCESCAEDGCTWDRAGRPGDCDDCEDAPLGEDRSDTPHECIKCTLDMNRRVFSEQYLLSRAVRELGWATIEAYVEHLRHELETSPAAQADREKAREKAKAAAAGGEGA